MRRDHIARFSLAPDERPFRASNGGIPLSEVNPQVQGGAKGALPGTRAYAARRVEGQNFVPGSPPTWTPPGHRSVAVFYRFHARVLDGCREQANALIDRAMQEAEEG